MKRIFTAIVCILAAVEIQALDFMYDGIRYEVTSTMDLTVKVIKKSYSSSYSGSVIIPETVVYSDKTFTVTGIDDYVFVDARSLTDVTFPKTLVSLGSQLFNNCQNLKRITVDPDNPSFCDIDGVMFTKDKETIVYYPNAKGSEYTLPETTKIIGEEAFGVCWNLKSLTLNEGLETISKNAFYYTKELTSLHLPASMKIIEKYAFDRCAKLKQIWVYSNQPFTIYAKSFSDDIYLNATLYVPEGTKDAYSLRTGWENFFSVQEFDAAGICQTDFTDKEEIVSTFDLSGKRLPSISKGVNLIRYRDGKVRKMLVK